MRTNLFSLLSVALIAGIVFSSSAPSLEAASRSSRDAYKQTMSADDLAEAYADAQAGGEKVRILIMPGHEPSQGGAEFMGYYERELVVDIANRLQKELSTDSNLEVLVARGNQGWNSNFEKYFDRQGAKIERFVDSAKKTYDKLLDRGRVDEDKEQSAHNEAARDVALRLYGVSKWSNENDVDLVLHLHLNDELGHGSNQRGAHSGAAIYVPDEMYGNAEVSLAIAEPIFERLKATNAISSFGLETEGIVESRELIAVGAFNTSEAPSLLVEYGYIYEPRIADGPARNEVFDDFAYQTALGVKDFFGSAGRPRYESKVLPHTFSTDVLATSTASTSPDAARDIYALQAALRELGFYPGTEASLGVCPVSGIMNPCTVEALKAFQASKGLAQAATFGPQTRTALNASFGLATPVLATVPAPAALTPTAPVAAAPGCSAFTGELAVDATDEATNGEVTRLQTLLAKDKEIYPEGKVTGYFGPATLAAIKRFQVKEAIVTPASSAYGLVGPATKAALLKQCSA
ncbi:MAG TPA: peptidoglycan-binding protein [Candidatus Paceibacterota bacterium]|nr:peptidoglycan-binding protein [Candidatus Paceibacterota bacterium]